MPHYQDGTEAKVGDIARGKPYNTNRIVEGVVTQVTPSESCNLVVTFADVKPMVGPTSGIQGIPFETDKGVKVAALTYDYGETKAFELVRRGIE